VTERTAEIGLLCAIGAPRSQIGVLFLVESAMLGACGGVMGVGVAIALVFMLQWFVPTFPVALVWVYVAGAFGGASVIGILAGLTPALKAAKMNPVDALRAN
jgi:putative ABC transport system permease protein